MNPPSELPIDPEFDHLEDWYTRQARPFLVREEANRVVEFDADLERLRDLKRTIKDELAVCFLGVAGVGKSTLINSLVAGREMILPSGGIGPLTAQALTVRRGTQPGFEARYHPAKQLRQILFALERGHDLARKRSTLDEATPAAAVLDSEELVYQLDSIEFETEAVSATEPESGGKLIEFTKQARLLVTGDQDGQADLAYLIDSLRDAIGMRRVCETEARPADEPRIRKLRAALALAQEGQSYRRQGAAVDFDFRNDLAHHAAGFLAPLISTLEVTWNGDLADEEVVLVDLPGVGIANDIYRNVTQSWIREQARSVILVAGNRGVTEADAELLRSSGFLNRLLYSFENPADDPVSLMVAVVRLDDSAETRWSEEKARGITGKKKQEYFCDLCAESAQKVRHDLKQELEKVWASAGLGEGQTRVIENLTRSLEIYPLSAVQYRKQLIDDEEDRSFLTDAEQSNVPGLRSSLLRQARERREATAARIDAEGASLAAKIVRELDLIRAQWLEADRASQEAERLREEFLVFLGPRKEYFVQRRGEFRNFLKETLPEVIKNLVARARSEARKEIAAYLQTLKLAHFKTLQAAVRKGGTFSGARRIDLPRDFALRFEVPIAEVWGKEILKRIRAETKSYADVCVKLVEEVVVWAQGQGAKFPTRVVEAQRDVIKADLKDLELVGRTMVHELREQVSRRLARELEKPIRDRCQKFVGASMDVGGGVRDRVIDLFGDLADQATEEASGVAVEIIQGCFREVEQQILAGFNRHKDPLEAVKEAIISSHAQWKRRSDAQKKRRVVDEVNGILASVPLDPDEATTAAAEVAA